MTTLPDFLLSRIADDETQARMWPAELPAGVAPDGLPWRDSHGHFLYAPRDRVLAECAAKRAIVNLHPEAVTCDMLHGATWAWDEVLRRLALAYADHPDYQQEWTP